MDKSVNVDFKELSLKAFQHFAEYERNVKEVYIKKSVVPLAKFYEELQEEYDTINSEITPTKESGTVAEYAELFKIFEEYPSNLQKPKKRELQRTNSTIIRGSTTTLADVSVNHASVTSPTLSTSKLEDDNHQRRSAYEVYNDFKKFQHKLRKAQLEAKNLTKVEEEYLLKLRELGTFAQQLKKLMPDGDHELAFNREEQQKLVDIAENMEQLNFIRENSSLFQQPIEGSNHERLKTLVDVLTYTLMQISI